MVYTISRAGALLGRTKVIATLGPASVGIVGELITRGVDIFRVNCSHGGPDEHAEYVHAVRSAANEIGATVGVLMDLCGPKIRTGEHKSGKPLQLRRGERLTLTCGAQPFKGDADSLYVNYARLAEDVEEGDTILLSDGMLQVNIERIDGNHIHTRVANAAALKERQGINVPGADLSIPSLTAKDLRDIDSAAAQQADFVAMSFVRSAQDVIRCRDELRDAGATSTKLVAKIETPQAVEHIADIAHVADAVMVARGDLGVEMPAATIPLVQRDIIRRCRADGVPTIVATQMLESMVASPRPTRAEASDVANAVFEGADAVMLSAETSIGAYPREAVETMNVIAQTTEDGAHDASAAMETPAVIAHAVRAITQASNSIKAVAVFTASGATARAVEADVPVIAFTPSVAVARSLTIERGVVPVVQPGLASVVDLSNVAEAKLKDLGVVSRGDSFALVASHPLHMRAPTNLLKVVDVVE